MLIEDQGVEQQSLLDFHMPSKFAEQHLFYIEQFGHFYCNEHYLVDRSGMPSCLLCYVNSGKIRVQSFGSCCSESEFNGRVHSISKNTPAVESEAVEGQFICLNCTYPHSYRAVDRADFLWFHFSGAASIAYCNLINQRFGLIIDRDDNRDMKEQVRSIIHLPWKEGFSEHRLSVKIHNLLAELAEGGGSGMPKYDEQIDYAIHLIQCQYQHTITVEDLAEKVHLSTYHFIRMFKKHTNSTPYEYLLNVRLRHAKRLLQTTTLTNEKIAFESGFNSGSHFARAFRKRTGMSPGEFRREQF